MGLPEVSGYRGSLWLLPDRHGGLSVQREGDRWTFWKLLSVMNSEHADTEDTRKGQRTGQQGDGRQSAGQA